MKFNRLTDVPQRDVHASVLSHTTSYKNRKDAECSHLLRQRDRPLEGNEKVKFTTAKARDFGNRPSYLKLGEYCMPLWFNFILGLNYIFTVLVVGYGNV